MNRKHPNLFAMLISLTVLFIAMQLSFFFIHYHVSDLVDTLTQSSISHTMLHPIILFPIIAFIFLQLGAYLLFVYALWFIAISTSELFKLSNALTYTLGIFFWILACIAIFALNGHYFPRSFFAEAFHQYPWLNRVNSIILASTLSILTMASLLAYINFFWHKRHLILGSIFLALGLIVLITASFTPAQQPAEDFIRPNIILIGLDSLRPDFIHYLGNKEIHTPNIDNFLQSASTFTNAYTPLARTFPAWVSILTAKYPKHHHARINLAESASITANDTLAKRLKAEGYVTIYGTDEVRFTDITRDYGFDRIIGPKGGAVEFLLGGLSDFPFTNLLVNLPFGRFLFPYNYGNRAADITYEPDKFLQLVKFGLADRPKKPVFLAIHLCLSHWPFTWAQDNQSEKFILPERYQSSVEAVDKQLGELLNTLKQAGLLKHSLVVLLSDHGTTVGMLNDRLVSEKNYRGDKSEMKSISFYRLSSAPSDNFDVKHAYSMATSYGQGTDVLSLKQYRVLLGFQGFGIKIPAGKMSPRSSLLDIAPTILDMLHTKPLQQVDGVSLTAYFSSKQKPKASSPFFIETADTIADIETDKIFVDKIVKKMIHAYQIDLSNGLLFVNPSAETSIIENKQRAVILGDWLLAKYPAATRIKLTPIPGEKRFHFVNYVHPAYFVLINLRTGLWTVGLSSSFAKKAPVKGLMREFKEFYGGEV